VNLSSQLHGRLKLRGTQFQAILGRKNKIYETSPQHEKKLDTVAHVIISTTVASVK
jgi:hypothetical protein